MIFTQNYALYIKLQSDLSIHLLVRSCRFCPDKADFCPKWNVSLVSLKNILKSFLSCQFQIKWWRNKGQNYYFWRNLKNFSSILRNHHICSEIWHLVLKSCKIWNKITFYVIYQLPFASNAWNQEKVILVHSILKGEKTLIRIL